MDKRFQWTEFYMELASALLPYKNNRSDLIAKLKTIFADAGMNFPFKERGKEVYEDICPFTVFGSFNKGITNANRIALLEQFAKQFSIKAAVPTEFDGIPVVMNLSAWFFAYKENRGEHDIDNLWDLLEKAIAYSDEASTDNKNAFIAAYDTVTKQKMIKWNITMGLYWARPYTFINLDSTNRAFITDVDNMPHYFTTIFSDINKGLPNGRNYLFMCEQAKNALNQKEYEYHSFPELSYYAWKSNQSGKTEETTTTTVDSNIKETNYWIYSPGDNASMWDEFYKFSIMGIGWDDVTDLKGFSSKEEINWNNEMYKNSNHTMVLAIKKEAEAKIVFYREQIIAKVNKKSLIHSDQTVNKQLQAVQDQFKDYQLALYTLAFSSFLDVMLVGNYDKEYLSGISEKLDDYSMKYRELYTQCYEEISGYSATSIQSSLLKGLSKTTKAVGKIVERIPVVGDTQADETLIAAGEKLGDMGTEKIRKQMRQLIERQSNFVRPFIDNIDTVNRLNNNPVQLLVDKDNLYIATIA